MNRRDEQAQINWLTPEDPEVWGRDYYDDEIYADEGFYDFDGDWVLEDNVDRYVKEVFIAQADYRVAGR